MVKPAHADAAIRRIVKRIVEGYAPEQVILYGSYAYGAPDSDSDIDLLIIRETDETPRARRVRVRRLATDPKRRIPFSPLVLTPGELHHRLQMDDDFYREILNRGRVLYARR